MADAPRPTPTGASTAPARRPWSLPTLRELPKLTDLTLASAIGGGGGTGGGGSTVFGLLLAAGIALLSACSADQTAPSAPAMPKAVAMISCTGDVAAKKISCATPQAAPGQEILAGQGFEVALRSSNIFINAFNEFTFDVSLQNLSTQRLGWDGSTPSGEEVFFVDGPTPDVGTMTVMGGSTGTFTAPNQDYYQYIGALDPQQTSGTVNWRLHMSPAVTTFTFTVLVAADVFDQGGVLQWTPIDGTTQRRYNDVVASSLTDWMAVGNNGLTAHYTGGKWVPLPAIVSENINAVTAIAPGEYLAATGGGAVLHFKNKVWTEIYRRVDFGTFNAIWAKDTTLIVAVGTLGRISRLSGGSWTDEDVPTLNGGGLAAVSGNASGSSISAVNGDFQATEVWTSTAGGPFTVDPTFAVPVHGIGTDVVYDASGHALVAWIDTDTFTGIIQSSTGDTVWTGAGLWPQALEVTGTNRIALGQTDLFGGSRTLTDVDYSSLPSSSTNISGTLPVDFGHLMPIDAAGTHFLVTSPNNQHLYRWDGATWSDEQGFGDWFDPDLWGIGDSIYALDGIGGFYKIVNGVRTSLPSVAGIHRLWGMSSTTFWAVDATEVWHFDPVDGWTDEHTVPLGSDNRDVWADPSGDAVIALGENGEISSRILGTWSDTAIGHNVTAVWGCDAHHAWITTLEGQVYKWIDGAVTLDSALVGTPLRAINGDFCGEMWVAGDNGVIYHRSGGGPWTNRFDPSAGGWTLRALALRGPNQTIAAGDDGNAGLFSDASQVQETPLPTQGGGIQALWRLSNGEVYAAGDQVLLRGYR